MMYILKGQEPISVSSLMVWGRWFKRADRAVALTKLADCEISTVFLGLGHGFDKNGDPLLFETMVFGGPLDLMGERYTTWAEAEAGHQRMIDRVAEASHE